MTCCGRKGVDQSTPDSTWTNMEYTGSSSVNIMYSGYLRRRYLVSRGWSGLVHPDDIARLERTRHFSIVQLPQPQAVIVEPVAVVAEPVKEISASATVIKLAEANGIDLQTVEGSGRGGKIVKRDIEGLISNG